MKIKITARQHVDSQELHYIKTKISDGRMPDCLMLDNLTLDQIESLELQLTEIVQQLYAYRKEHESD